MSSASPTLAKKLGPPNTAKATWRRVPPPLRRGTSLGAGGWLLAVILVTVFAPLIAPQAPNSVDFTSVFQGPSAGHLLGTDDLGRDVLSRLIYGGRESR